MEACSRKSPNVHCYLSLSRIFYLKKIYLEAIHYLEVAQSLFPNKQDVLSSLVICCEQASLHESHLNYLKQLSKLTLSCFSSACMAGKYLAKYDNSKNALFLGVGYKNQSISSIFTCKVCAIICKNWKYFILKDFFGKYSREVS